MYSVFTLRDHLIVIRLVDFAIVFTFIEYVFLGWRRRWRQNEMIDLLFALSPGVCLMLALRVALSGAGPVWAVALMSASLPLHLVDLTRRTRR